MVNPYFLKNRSNFGKGACWAIIVINWMISCKGTGVVLNTNYLRQNLLFLLLIFKSKMLQMLALNETSGEQQKLILIQFDSNKKEITIKISLLSKRYFVNSRNIKRRFVNANGIFASCIKIRIEIGNLYKTIRFSFVSLLVEWKGEWYGINIPLKSIQDCWWCVILRNNRSIEIWCPILLSPNSHENNVTSQYWRKL